MKNMVLQSGTSYLAGSSSVFTNDRFIKESDAHITNLHVKKDKILIENGIDLVK